jgi:hypothetical protein
VREAHVARGLAVTLDSPAGGPASLIARAELHFLEGPLAGLALRGFSVWRGTTAPFVTLPRLSSAMPFLRPSRLAAPGLADESLAGLRAAILTAHSKR